MALIKADDGNNIYTWKSDDIRDAEIYELTRLRVQQDSIFTGDLNELLSETTTIKLIHVFYQQGGGTLQNWIGQCDGYVICFSGMFSLAYNGWDLSARPYYKVRWGSSWSGWIQL